MYKVLLANNQFLIQQGIKRIIETVNWIEIVAEAKNEFCALELLRGGLQVDIVICDFLIFEEQGWQALDELTKDHPQLKLIMLCMDTDIDTAGKIIARGASGCLQKNADVDEILLAINLVGKGKVYLSHHYSQDLLKHYQDNKRTFSVLQITERETAVLIKLGNGFTTTEIAEQMFRSKRTIEGIRQGLLEKTLCSNTASLIKYAVKNGLIS